MKKVIWAIDPYQSNKHELHADARRLSAWFGREELVLQPVFVLTSGVRMIPSSHFKSLLPELKWEAARLLRQLHTSWKGLSISPPRLLVHPSDHVENIADILMDFSRGEGADLLVLRTHGRRGMARFILGSLSESLLKRAQVPILILPKQARASAAKSAPKLARIA